MHKHTHTHTAPISIIQILFEMIFASYFKELNTKLTSNFQEGKSKKRKREDGEKNPAKQRDQQLQQQVDEYNVSTRMY